MSRRPPKPSARYSDPKELIRASTAKYPITKIEEASSESDEAEVSSNEEEQSKLVPSGKVSFMHPHGADPVVTAAVSPGLPTNLVPESSLSFSTAPEKQDPASEQLSELDEVVDCCEGFAAQPNEAEYKCFLPREGQEDVASDGSATKAYKQVHDNMISHPDMKTLIIRGKKMVDMCIGAMGNTQGAERRSPRMMTCDFKEGRLEKKSSSLLTSWKEKHCRVGNSQFMFFKNLQTGLMSGLVDFRRVPAGIVYDVSVLTFTYY